MTVPKAQEQDPAYVRMANTEQHEGKGISSFLYFFLDSSSNTTLIVQLSSVIRMKFKLIAEVCD